MNVDKFPCGCLVTDSDFRIIDMNAFFSRSLGWKKSDLIGQSINTILSNASRIFCGSYVRPLITHEKRCDEIQLSVMSSTDSAGVIPMVVSAVWAGGQEDPVFWSFFSGKNRDKLYQELISAREKLELLNENLSKIAVTDELTKLVNRREMERRGAIEFERAKRGGKCLSVVMVDLDHFKQVNDNYGHAEGDAVLRDVGAVLARYARVIDVAARYGGEEFMLILPETDGEQAVALTERIHQLLHTIESKAGKITASMGVSTFYGEDSLSLDDLIKYADSALYHAKETGRNRTTSFPYEH